MVSWLKIIYKPQSILGLIICVGLFFMFLGGITMPYDGSVSLYFKTSGYYFVYIGLCIWILFVLPTILGRWNKLFNS